MSKVKTKLLIGLFFIACLCFALSFTVYFKTEAQTLTANFFETRFMSLSPEYYDENTDTAGLLVSANAEDAYAITANPVCGVFSINYLVENPLGKTVKFDFIDAENSANAFSIYVSSNSAYIGVNGVKAGLYYYYDNGAQVYTLYGVTAGYNNEGKYTQIDGTGLVAMSFNPNSGKVICGGREVWDLSQESNDGKYTGYVLNGFNSYYVRISFENESNGGLLIKSINESSFDGAFIENSIPSVSANIKCGAVKSVEYTVAKPYAYDIKDGVIQPTNVSVKITSSNNQVIYDELYREDLKVVFPSVGKGKIVYRVVNSKDKTAMASYDVNVVEDITQTDTEIFFGSYFSEGEYGKGTKLILPQATLKSGLLKRAEKLDVVITVKCNNVVLEGYDGIKANQINQLVLSEVGNYVITYSVENNLISYSKSFEITVRNDIPSFTDAAFASEYVVGFNLSLPNIDFNINGQTVRALKAITLPSGAKYKSNTIKLTEVGTYCVEYSVSNNDTEYSFVKKFEVLQDSCGLFSSNGAIMESSFCSFNNDYKGVLVSQKGSQIIKYDKIINLNDNSAKDLLIELMVQPTTIGKADFAQIIVTLTDIYDPENYVDIILEDSSLINGKGALTYLRTAATGQNYGAQAGYGSRFAIGEGKWTGMALNHSFMGTLYEEATPGVGPQSIKLYFDYAEKQLYTTTFFDVYYMKLRTQFFIGENDNWKKYFDTQEQYDEFYNKIRYSTLPDEIISHIKDAGIDPWFMYYAADYDDPKCYPTIWKGFTTGECYLTLSVKGVSANSAKYVICNIDGIDLSDAYAFDNAAPIIELDKQSENPAKAIVGRAYPVFDYKVFDKFSSTKTDVAVYYNYVDEGGGRVSLVDGCFTPTVAGKYTIVYNTYDESGNSATKTVDIVAVDSLEDIVIDVKTAGDSAIYVGCSAKFPEITVQNAAGNYVVSYYATFNGTQTAISAVDFVPEKAGRYLITLQVSDYIGRTKEISYELDASISPEPILGDVYVPYGMVDGETYKLPELYAKDYSSGTLELVKCAVFVSDKNGTYALSADNNYTPSVNNDLDTVEIKYVLKGAEKIYSAVCRKPYDGGVYKMDRYFVSDDVSFSTTTNSVKASTNVSNAEFTFAKPILASSFNFEANVDYSQNYCDSFRIILVDSENPNEKVIFNIIKDGDKTTSILRVNNGVDIEFAGSFTQNTVSNFRIQYSNTVYTITDATGVIKTSVTEYSDGKAFKGFSSGFVYMTVQFGKVVKTTALYLTQINNQPLSDDIEDAIDPVMVLKSDLGNNFEHNSKAYLPQAIGFDVLSKVESLTVTLMSPTSKVVSAVDGTSLSNADGRQGYEFIASEYGVYSLSYKITDSAGWMYTLRREITVTEKEPPVITISGELPKKASVGDVITIPKATASDNFSGNTGVYVLYINPYNYMQIITTQTILLGVKGQWKIQYFTYDVFFNYVLQEFIIEVS